MAIILVVGALVLAFSMQPAPATAGRDGTDGIGPGRGHVWVSPEGDDAAPGTRTQPAQTLHRAQEMARDLLTSRSPDSSVRGVTVHVGGGRYRLSEPLVMDARDGGDRSGAVLWTAMPGKSPSISGGHEIASWTPHDADAGIWRADAPAGLEARQLFVDGRRKTRARETVNPTAWTRTRTGYQTTDATVTGWQAPSAVEVVATRNWRTFRCPMAAIAESASGATVTMRDPCWDNAVLMHSPWGNVDKPRWVENSYTFLDEPGEWFLDTAADTVYYKPPAGQDPNRVEVIAAGTERLVELRGSAGSPVQNLTFRRLTFEHAGWLSPSTSEGYAEVQSGFHLVGPHTAEDFTPRPNQTIEDWARMPGAVRLEHAHDVRFEGNTFRHLGAAALDLDTGVKGSRIVGNRFLDLSGTAVQIGGIQTHYHHPDDERLILSDNEVSNNYIGQAGAEYFGAVAVWGAYTRSTRVEHNLMHDLPYSGVSLGWGWGDPEPGGALGYDTPTPETGNRVEANWIFDTHQVLVDGGAVYTLGDHKNGVVTRNFIHDIHYAGGFATEGFFLDEASRHVTLIENVTCSVQSGIWLKFHKARDNVARTNYTDAAEVEYVNAGPNEVEDTVVLNGPLPPAALKIAREAGPRGTYRHVLPGGFPSADATAVCGSRE